MKHKFGFAKNETVLSHSAIDGIVAHVVNIGVVNIEEMDEQEAWQFLVELFTNLSPEAEYDARHEDFVMEMPQSGERIRGRERMRAFQEAYPTATPPTIRLRRVLVREGLWVAEGVYDAGGEQAAARHGGRVPRARSTYLRSRARIQRGRGVALRHGPGHHRQHGAGVRRYHGLLPHRRAVVPLPPGHGPPSI